jgi:hypothetical protein
MTRTSLLAASAAATALLAAPGAALASGTVTAGPIKAKGYTLTLTAGDNGANDYLAVSAFRSSGGSYQMHSWTFRGAKVAVKGATATIKGNLGRYGKLDAKVRTSGGPIKGSVPAGCKGKPGSARRGLLTGNKLVLDTTFFRTLKLAHVKAQIVKAGKIDCSGPGSGGSGGGSAGSLMLMSSVAGADGQLTFSVLKTGSTVQQIVSRSDAAAATAPATVVHMISARTGASGLTAASDLSSATAPAAGPFLTGTFAFAGTPMGTMATGSASGGFAARFDSIGTQALPDGTDAMLMSR